MKRQIIGKVIEGNKRGKKLGFPTANIKLHRKIEQGIYASKTKVGGKEYKSVTFIGNATTFGEKEIKAESHLLDFDKNIYGKYISIVLVKKIRGNKKFKDEKELVGEMKRDLEAAKKILS